MLPKRVLSQFLICFIYPPSWPWSFLRTGMGGAFFIFPLQVLSRVPVELMNENLSGVDIHLLFYLFFSCLVCMGPIPFKVCKFWWWLYSVYYFLNGTSYITIWNRLYHLTWDKLTSPHILFSSYNSSSFAFLYYLLKFWELFWWTDFRSTDLASVFIANI